MRGLYAWFIHVSVHMDIIIIKFARFQLQHVKHNEVMKQSIQYAANYAKEKNFALNVEII